MSYWTRHSLQSFVMMKTTGWSNQQRMPWEIPKKISHSLFIHIFQFDFGCTTFLSCRGSTDRWNVCISNMGWLYLTFHLSSWERGILPLYEYYLSLCLAGKGIFFILNTELGRKPTNRTFKKIRWTHNLVRLYGCSDNFLQYLECRPCISHYFLSDSLFLYKLMWLASL